MRYTEKWKVRLIAPQNEQHRTLQDAVSVLGMTQAVQEPFQPILRQEQLEILAPFPCQCQQTVTH